MIDILKKASLKASVALLKYFESDFKISEKTSHHNLVTEADYESQKIIKEVIVEEMVKRGHKESEVGFIGEENLVSEGRYTFVIDPLDGTATFATGLPYFAISIGVFVNEKLTYGCVYLPVFKVFYIAELGKGAYKETESTSQKLKMTGGPLKNMFLGGGLNVDEKIRHKQIHAYEVLLNMFRGFLAIYATVPSICLVAEEKSGVHFTGYSCIWDLAAVKIIVEEAGGIMTDWKGKPLILKLDKQEGYQSLSCHPDHLKEIVDAINS